MGTPDWPTAESHTVQRSGVAIVLAAANTVGGLIERQAQAIAEIRALCSGETRWLDGCSVIPRYQLLAILDRQGL